MASQTATNSARHLSPARSPLGAVWRDSSEPSLLLTGERYNKRFCVYVDDKPVELSYSVYSALLRLIAAVDGVVSGFVTSEAVTIRRLRQAFDQALGPGTGARLIQTGCATEYRLTIPKTQIAIAPSFFELEDINVITPAQAGALRAKFLSS